MDGINLGNIGQNLRNRLEQVRTKIGMRQPMLLRGQTTGAIGQGKIIENVRARANQLLEKIRERKPNIIPKATESLKGWKLGERVKVLVEGETPPTGKTSTKLPVSEKYPLRK